MDTPGPAGAEAFYGRFWDVYMDAYHRGDTADLQELSDPGCRFCRSAVDDIRGYAAKGWTVRGGDITVDGAAAVPREDRGDVLVNGVVSQAAFSASDSSGARMESRGAVPVERIDMVVQWRQDRWVVLGVDVVSGDDR